MKRENVNKLITEALAIEAEEAQRAGALGFIARALTQATLPHKSVPGNEFTRRNGLFTLSIMSPSIIGLPYGSIPRLLVSWVTTEAVRTRSPELELGPTLSGFMRGLGLSPTGGRWGSITRLRDQMMRLFASSITCIYEEELKTGIYGVKIVKEAHLWWDPKSPEQIPLWRSTLTLSSDFFQELINNPVPVDMRALKALKRSPLALDIYCWLTYRMSYLRKATEIPWAALQTQFGADYSRTIDFKVNFLKHFQAVLVVYPEAKVEEGERGLLLRPSKPHIAKLPETLGRIPAKELSLPPFPSPEPKAVTKQALVISKADESSAIWLSTETFEKAKKVAPGLDVYYLEQEWREWVAGKERPKNPDAAFIGFCKQKYQKQGRS